LSRRIGQVLVEKGCPKWFDSRRLHHFFSALGQVWADAATTPDHRRETPLGPRRRSREMWSYMAALSKVTTNPLGDNPHPLVL
jgi:hypothetical protein